MENNLDKNLKLYNLTSPQQNIWTVEQLNPNTNINNVFGTFLVHQNWDIDILQKAINKIIENNDALRIRIVEKNSKPMQYFSNYEYENLPVYFLDSDDSEQINSIINTIGLENMNLINSKLYDLRIISTPSSTYVCLKMHHMIADGWSMGQIFIENIKKYYNELEENRVVNTTSSYLDYIEKNEEYKNSEKYSKDEAYWKNYVKNISTENKFEIVKNKTSKRIVQSINPNLAEKINYFCKNNHISEFTFWMGLISIYFSKLLDDDNIIIGTPFLNRKKSHKEFDIMGMFVATLPIYVHIVPEMSFVELCKKIASTNFSCSKHANYPYNQIQQEYNNITGENTNLYEIAFSYQINDLTKSFDPTIFKTTWQPNNTQINPLVISYVNYFGEEEICYDFWTSLFEDEEIARLHERFESMINQILKQNNPQIRKIKIYSKSDSEKLQLFNTTGNLDSSNDTIVSLFSKVVEKNKSKIAIKYNDIQISYQELEKKSNSVANCIIKSKIKKGSPIAMIFDKNIEMFITMLGILKTGCYYIPILPEEEQERAEYIIQNSEAQLLITEKKYSTQISKAIIEKQFIVEDLLNESEEAPNVSIKPTDLCYLIYTSGSTGKPKGVMMKHENVTSFIKSINADENLKFDKNDIAISLLKYSFDAAAADIYTMLLNGGKLILLPKSLELSPLEIAKLIEKEKITRIVTVSKWVEEIQHVGKHYRIDLSSLKKIAIGGEALKVEKFKYLYDKYKDLKLCNVYGPTEATIFTTFHRINDDDIQNNYIPIGKPIPYSRAIIMNKNNEILPINTKGELVIFEDDSSIHNIAQGYFKLEEKTKQNFIKFENPYTQKIVRGYKTGDSAKINSNLELDFYGRNDDYKKVNGGYLVSLTEVENNIQRILGSNIGVAVVSVPIRKLNSIILFVCKKSDSTTITISDIKSEIDEHLTFYMRPRKIIEIEKFPFTTNGKIDKHFLENEALQQINQKNDNLLPKNKTEQKIYDILKEIVNSDFSITDDFEDDLGMDSLSMSILYSKIGNNKISIQDLYNYPNVKDLAYIIKKEKLEENEEFDVETVKIQNTSTQIDLTKVLLAGSTGFVGAQLLRELALNANTEKIYCLVRQNLTLTSEERFENKIKYYFDEDTYNIIKSKAIILNGDLRRENFGLKETVYNRTFKDVKTIINCVANVKHIGKYNSAYIDNVQTVNNVIKTCLEFDINLAHISTLSLNGYKSDNTTEIFSENTLDINQTFHKNPYLITKFEAEQCVLKSISENHLNAKIFRIGNIMPRISDGIFQTNYEQNGFLLAINGLNNLQLITDKLLRRKICLTPADECARAIVQLLKNDFCNTIYHIEHPQKLNLSTIIDLLKARNTDFSLTTDETFFKKLRTNYSFKTEYLKNLVFSDFNKYTSDITYDILDKLQFTWQPIQKNYLENIINIAMKIK